MSTRIKKAARILLSAGAIQYILLIAVAMFFYPGGTKVDPNTVGYTFFSNYFSDLGQTVAYNGVRNLIASVLYYIANVIYGVSLIPFFSIIASEFPTKKLGKGAGKVSAIFGVIAGLGTLTYAVAPSDILSMVHNLGVAFGYFGTFFAILFLGIASKRSDKNLKGEGIFLVSVAIGFIATLVLMGVGGATENLFLEMLMQKTGKYLTMVIFAIEGIKWLKR